MDVVQLIEKAKTDKNDKPYEDIKASWGAVWAAHIACPEPYSYQPCRPYLAEDAY